MQKKIEKYFIESLIVISIVGMIVILIYRIIEPKGFVEIVHRGQSEYPITFNVIGLLIFLPFAIWNFSDIKKPRKKGESRSGVVYRLILFSGVSLYFLYHLVKTLLI